MTDTTALPGRGLKPLTSLLAHPGLALAALLLVLVAGLPVAWLKGSPRYQAEAALQVAPRYMRNLREDQELDFQSNTQYRQFVEHQRKSVSRQDVLRDALDRLGPQRSLWQRPGESDRRAVERLREQLQVSSVPDTYLIRLRLEAGRPEGLAEVVNAVSASFVERMKAEQIYGADERTRHLQSREQELLRTIEARSEQRHRIARALGLTTFNEGTPNPYDRLLSDLRAKLVDARQRRVDADAAVAAFARHGDTQVNLRSVQDAVLNDPGLNSLKGALNTRRAGLLVQKSGLRPDHPGALSADRELGEIEREIEQRSRLLETQVRGNLGARLRGTAEQAASVEAGLQADLQQLEARAAEFARDFHQAMTLTSDMAQARAELDKVRERVNYLHVESTSFGFLRLVSPALAPELPFGPGRRKLLLAVLLAALGAGVAAPVLRDLLDRRVRTVNDAQRLLGITPAGWQVERANTASQVFADEQLRRLAATLIRQRDTHGRQVYGFSACKPGAGTSTLVLELGQTLQRLGYRVMTVEANGRHPDARYASGRPGLIDWLRGRAELPALAAPAGEDQPARVAIGGREGCTLERLDRLGSALQDWSQAHDFVLVDMPALLSSADAELLVRVVGQVLLVVQADAVTRGEVLRARRLLQALDPAAVGLVVNRITPFQGGGYLRELMLESISARTARAVLSVPHWRLQLAALPVRLGRLLKKGSP